MLSSSTVCSVSRQFHGQPLFWRKPSSHSSRSGGKIVRTQALNENEYVERYYQRSLRVVPGTQPTKNNVVGFTRAATMSAPTEEDSTERQSKQEALKPSTQEVTYEAPNDDHPIQVSDGCDAAAYVAHRLSEVIAIYPITPSTPLGEASDLWSAQGRGNLWGSVPVVAELQSEAGAAGAVHGALQTGALSTTFTASQGLLLMIPEMYKIAGELLPYVMYVTARSLAAQGLSIFGDHTDVMAVRSTGFSMLSSANVQEVQDMSLIAHAVTLETRVPILHFFDGFRTSHEIQKIERLSDADMHALISDELIMQHRSRALSPEHPVMRGTAQNPDVYFQGRETVQQFVNNVPDAVQAAMDKLADRVGRQYKLMEYSGHPEARHVVIMMGASCGITEQVIEHLNTSEGYKCGLIKVRLFRPFPMKQLLEALPKSTCCITVLEKTKETGAQGEPLYQDVVSALHEDWDAAIKPQVLGGRYGLGSKDFTPAMVKAVLDNMRGWTGWMEKKEKSEIMSRRHFTIGIEDDVCNSSIPFDPEWKMEPPQVKRALFYGMGGDGTVGASKNSVKIIGEETDLHIQGYFDYDSKKAGSGTISHLRFSKEPIDAAYLIPDGTAQFISVHFPSLIYSKHILDKMAPGGTLLLNSYEEPEKVWDTLPKEVQEAVISKQIEIYVVNATKVARESGMGRRVNTIMQTCFFAIADIIPKEEAITAIRSSVVKSYSKKGQKVVDMNFKAIDMSLENMHRITVPTGGVTSTTSIIGSVKEHKGNPGRQVPFDPFMSKVTEPIIFGQGNSLPVSALPVDGTFPTGTSTWDKLSTALSIPVWEPEICIQCNKCVAVCPHAAIRAKPMEASVLDGAPSSFKSAPAKGMGKDFPKDLQYSIQVTPDGCTGCTLCVDVCPAASKEDPTLKAINMRDNTDTVTTEGREGWNYFETLPYPDRQLLKVNSLKGSQFLEPLFEFSAACAGCGETPYVKLVSQLFGDRLVVANATGCSSIYGGNLPTTPWTKNSDGRGPAWMNSLFEDNAEFGFGMRLTVDQHARRAVQLVERLAGPLASLPDGEQLVQDILNNTPDIQRTEVDIQNQRDRVATLQQHLSTLVSSGSLPAGAVAEARELSSSLAEYLVRRSVWLMGGDGWAYDIGFGGLDHVLQTGADLNVLVLDTEGYANTGGQCSKSTPRAAVAKFAQSGKPGRKKDLGAIAMTYGNVYVGVVAIGANDAHTVKTFMEAEAYPGPSLIIAYSHCIAHGIDTATGHRQQKEAVDSGYWPLYRYNPGHAPDKNPLNLDSKQKGDTFESYASKQGRFTTLKKANKEGYEQLMVTAQDDVDAKINYLKQKIAGFQPPRPVDADEIDGIHQ